MSAKPSKTVAWFHCFAGIAGDMTLASLVDAGAPLEVITASLETLGLGRFSIEAQRVLRGGLGATYLSIRTEDRGHSRPYREVRGLVEGSSLPDRAAERALRVFSSLATVEAGIHGTAVDDVELHEVGSMDAIVDIVGTTLGLELLGVDEITASPVATGMGMVRSRHGMLPNPAPATLQLLSGVPVYGRDVPVELTTPTGAAILTSLSSSFGAMPPIVADHFGYGAGSAEVEGLPNCLRVVIGAASEASEDGQPLVVLETTVDDTTGEQLADTLSAMLDAGALDCWITSVLMKKGRPGHVVSALADPSHARVLRDLLVRSTGSFGVRSSSVERWSAARRQDTVEIDGFSVGIKVSAGRAKVEHDDALKVAEATGRSVAEITRRAESLWRQEDD